jgi:hypothetical protein
MIAEHRLLSRAWELWIGNYSPNCGRSPWADGASDWTKSCKLSLSFLTRSFLLHVTHGGLALRRHAVRLGRTSLVDDGRLNGRDGIRKAFLQAIQSETHGYAHHRALWLAHLLGNRVNALAEGLIQEDGDGLGLFALPEFHNAGYSA